MKSLCKLLTFLTLVAVACVFPCSAFGQRPEPTYKDIAYDGDDPAQKLDVYLASSDKPLPVMVFIHGGGWRAGSKNNVPAWLLRGVQNNDYSVVSVEYRFTSVAPHPAQTDDCLRAIQFVRKKAKNWNIDTSRIGVTGGSAGGHLSAYVALHDDIADPTSDDPIEQQSSRVALSVPFAGPTDWTLLDKMDHKHPAYRQLLGKEPGTAYNELPAEMVKDVSPATFASKDDPPIMIFHGDADQIVPVQHAHVLHKKLMAKGVESELVVVEGAGHGVAGAGGKDYIGKAEAFVKKHFSE